MFLSPLAKNCDLSLSGDLQSQAATEHNIIDFIENTLPQHSTELFFFYWGGHGVITFENERRLFFADASEQNFKNLDLNKSDYFFTSFPGKIKKL